MEIGGDITKLTTALRGVDGEFYAEGILKYSSKNILSIAVKMV